MTYAEMIAMPDNLSISEFGNNEEEKLSTDRTMTPIPAFSKHKPVSPASTVHNININYRHTYSVARKNDDEIDIPSLLQSLAHHTSVESPSAVITMANKAIDESIKQRKRKLFLDNIEKPLLFTALDISDPPHLKYYDNLDGLVKDWDDSSYLIIKGIPIALKYWSQVFRWSRPEVWEVLKDNWSNWRVISFILGIYEFCDVLPCISFNCLPHFQVISNCSQ